MARTRSPIRIPKIILRKLKLIPTTTTQTTAKEKACWIIDTSRNSSRHSARSARSFPRFQKEKASQPVGTEEGTTPTKIANGRVTKQAKKVAKRITQRRERIIRTFLEELLPQTVKLDTEDKWKLKLIRLLEVPPSRGKACVEPITLLDVDHWLKITQFSKMVQKLKQGNLSSPSSSSNVTVVGTSNQWQSTSSVISETTLDTSQKSESVSVIDCELSEPFSSPSSRFSTSERNAGISFEGHGNGETDLYETVKPEPPEEEISLIAYDHMQLHDEVENLPIQPNQNEYQVIAIDYSQKTQSSPALSTMKEMLHHSREIIRLLNTLELMGYTKVANLETSRPLMYSFNGILFSLMIPEQLKADQVVKEC